MTTTQNHATKLTALWSSSQHWYMGALSHLGNDKMCLLFRFVAILYGFAENELRRVADQLLYTLRTTRWIQWWTKWCNLQRCCALRWRNQRVTPTRELVKNSPCIACVKAAENAQFYCLNIPRTNCALHRGTKGWHSFNDVNRMWRSGEAWHFMRSWSGFSENITKGATYNGECDELSIWAYQDTGIIYLP